MAGKYTRNLTVAPSIDGSSLVTTSEETTDQLYKATVNDLSISFEAVKASTKVDTPYIHTSTGSDFVIRDGVGSTPLLSTGLSGTNSPRQPGVEARTNADVLLTGTNTIVPFNTIVWEIGNGYSPAGYAYYAPRPGVYGITVQAAFRTAALMPLGAQVEVSVQHNTVTVRSMRDKFRDSIPSGWYWWNTPIAFYAKLAAGDNIKVFATATNANLYLVSGSTPYGMKLSIMKHS